MKPQNLRRSTVAIIVAAAWLTCQVAPTLAAPSDPSSAIVAAFSRFCGDGDFESRHVLQRAEAAGWTRAGPRAPKGFDAASDRLSPSGEGDLIVRVSRDDGAGERRAACGVRSSKVAPDLVQETTRRLGVTPDLNLGTAATFFVARAPTGWISAARLSRDALREARGSGRYFSLIAGSTESGSSLVGLKVVADPNNDPAAAARGSP